VKSQKRAKLLTKEIIDLLELNDDEASSENESYTNKTMNFLVVRIKKRGSGQKSTK